MSRLTSASAHTPVMYGTFHDEAREAHIVVLENLTGLEVIDSASEPGPQREEYLRAAIQGIAAIHAIWYGREEELRQQPWLGQIWTTRDMGEMRELWEDLSVHAAREFPE